MQPTTIMMMTIAKIVNMIFSKLVFCTSSDVMTFSGKLKVKS